MATVPTFDRQAERRPDAGHHMQAEGGGGGSSRLKSGWLCTIEMDGRISFYNHFDSLGEIREIDHHHNHEQSPPWDLVEARQGMGQQRNTVVRPGEWIVNRLTAD